jgi:5-methyltetrahydrofolate--homocysteine methyltransferase
MDRPCQSSHGHELLISKVKAPLMIDTTDVKAIERVCPLARAYGAALVVGCIDEDPLQAQAFTREQYGIRAEDVLFDVLVFPCATGDENDIAGAVETIEGLRLIKARLPHVKTVLGVSNISFGLQPAAREVVNSVFLYHCTRAGLDLAIVNAEKLGPRTLDGTSEAGL